MYGQAGYEDHISTPRVHSEHGTEAKVPSFPPSFSRLDAGVVQALSREPQALFRGHATGWLITFGPVSNRE